MKIGATIPGSQFKDAASIKDYVQALEGAGFSYVTSAEHVAGGHPDRLRPGDRHTYDLPYHEPFVLFGMIAGITTTLEMMTTILVLPQRQTLLVAKQAAELDLLSNGRLRLGVGLGRNWMEYEALNEDFHNRGRRIEEQIALLRQLWTNELVTFEGKYHHIDRMGINPMPVQRPIPIWMGTFFGQVVERAIKRVAQLADGWLPQFPPNDELKAVLERMHGYAREAGRDPKTLQIQGGLRGDLTNEDEVIKQVQAWQELGAGFVGAGSGTGETLQERIDSLIRLREMLTKAGY